MSDTHFGFTSVDEAEKAGRVRGVFDSVAPKYDLMNDLMSMGLHRVWKRAAVKWSGAVPGHAALDVCCGSGDLAFRLAAAVGEVQNAQAVRP